MQRRTADDLHWEQLIRTMIDMLGVERFNDMVRYVVDEMNAERRKLRHFAVETRRTTN